MRLTNLPLLAQTAYAELFSQAQAFEQGNPLAGLVGAFHKRTINGGAYWYFGYRDIDQKLRMAYVGPDNERVRALVQRFAETRLDKPLAPPARMAIAAGCAPVSPKDFRVIRRLAEYGFFRAGGILIGTHAFLGLGNMLGVRWLAKATTPEADFSHAGGNVSLALPADIHVEVRGALESLEMGLLPFAQFNGKVGARQPKISAPELRLSLLTAMRRNGQPAMMSNLNLPLEPHRFIEFVLAEPVQSCVFSNLGACVVNLPAPERYAVHKLIICGERPVRERTKAVKDLLQAGSLASYFVQNNQTEVFNLVWREALGRGRGWQVRAEKGRAALLRIAPELDHASLWQAPRAR